MTHPAMSATRRRLTDNLRLLTSPAIIMLIILLTGWSLFLLLAFSSRFQTVFFQSTSMVVFGAASLLLLAVLIYRKVIQTRQWYVVPGGLVLRYSSWSSGKWKVRLFNRRCSVLIAYEAHNENWHCWVADAESDETLTGDENTITNALRAWLSPLEPPKIEQLSDLR